MPRSSRRSVQVVLLVLAFAATACGGQAEAPAVTPKPTPAQPEPVAIAELAHAVVQIVSFVDGQPDALGSGTIISPDGLILTNAHVVYPESGTLDRLEISVTDSPDAPPEATYRAEVAAADGALDLAVLRITERIDGNDVGDELPYVQLGDSDSLEIGDPLRILGYPGIGGETITLTSGQVSGFVSEAGLGRRAWIKTDATIAGGNSGGMAANEEGELIAVPTIAGASEEVVDCRPLRDTNRDGVVDDDDDCVPIGGFLNGLRPVALAIDMIAAVETGTAYEPIAEVEPAVKPADLDDVYWGDPSFASDVTADDKPVGEAIGFETSSTSLCAFWDYEGMQAGMRWSAEWSVNGTLDEEASFIAERWSLEESGSFWVCVDDEDGLEAGVYDVALLVEDEVFSTGFAHVGTDLTATEVIIRNRSEDTICYLLAAPYLSTSWGPDRLGETDVLDPGEELAFELVADDYDFRAEDCDLDLLFEESVDVPVGTSVIIEWSTGGLSVNGEFAGSLEGDLLEGDCISGEPGWSRANTDVVPCEAPHEYQIVGLIPYTSTDDAFPGDAAVDQLSEEYCYDAFEDFVGISYDRSQWYMTAWLPSAETWQDGDRSVICTVHADDEEPFTGSLAGAED